MKNPNQSGTEFSEFSVGEILYTCKVIGLYEKEKRVIYPEYKVLCVIPGTLMVVEDKDGHFHLIDASDFPHSGVPKKSTWTCGKYKTKEEAFASEVLFCKNNLKNKIYDYEEWQKMVMMILLEEDDFAKEKKLNE